MIETAKGSTIVKATPPRGRATETPPGLKRPDIIAALQVGDWAHLPLREASDGNYYLNAFVELGRACPSAEHEIAAMRGDDIQDEAPPADAPADDEQAAAPAIQSAIKVESETGQAWLSTPK